MPSVPDDNLARLVPAIDVVRRSGLDLASLDLHGRSEETIFNTPGLLRDDDHLQISLAAST